MKQQITVRDVLLKWLQNSHYDGFAEATEIDAHDGFIVSTYADDNQLLEADKAVNSDELLRLKRISLWLSPANYDKQLKKWVVKAIDTNISIWDILKCKGGYAPCDRSEGDGELWYDLKKHEIISLDWRQAGAEEKVFGWR